jgi:hypothetical protein
MKNLSKIILPKQKVFTDVDYTMPINEFERTRIKLYNLFDEKEKNVQEIRKQENGRIRIHFYTCLAGNCEPWDSWLDYTLRKEIKIKGLRRVSNYISLEEFLSEI